MIETDLDLKPIREFLQEFIATKGGNIADPCTGLCSSVEYAHDKYGNYDVFSFMCDMTRLFTAEKYGVESNKLGDYFYHMKKGTLYTGEQLELRLELANFILLKIDEA